MNDIAVFIFPLEPVEAAPITVTLVPQAIVPPTVLIDIDPSFVQGAAKRPVNSTVGTCIGAVAVALESIIDIICYNKFVVSYFRHG